MHLNIYKTCPSDAKLKEQFLSQLNNTSRTPWLSLKSVMEIFLWNYTVPEYVDSADNLLTNFKSLGCNIVENPFFTTFPC